METQESVNKGRKKVNGQTAANKPNNRAKLPKDISPHQESPRKILAEKKETKVTDSSTDKKGTKSFTTLAQNHLSTVPEKASHLWANVRVYLDDAPEKASYLLGKTREYVAEKKTVLKRGLIASVVLIFVIALFQNIEPSGIEFLFWSFHAPKLVMFLVMMGIGAAIGIWTYKKLLEIDEKS